MVIKLSQEQIANLTRRESNNYINKLHQIIVKNAPSLREDDELISRLNDADIFVNENGFRNEQVKTDFLITNAFEPGFYKTEAMKDWLFNGSESVESEYIKYQQIKSNLLKRLAGGVNE
jgi:hypothetical protein